MSITNYVQPAADSFAEIRRQTWRRLFGGLVEETRQAKGYTVSEAARLAGIEFSEWLAIEAGHVPADEAQLRSMAAALEISFDQLLLLVLICHGGRPE